MFPTLEIPQQINRPRPALENHDAASGWDTALWEAVGRIRPSAKWDTAHVAEILCKKSLRFMDSPSDFHHFVKIVGRFTRKRQNNALAVLFPIHGLSGAQELGGFGWGNSR